MKRIIISLLLISLIAISFICGWLGGKEATMNWAIEEQTKIEEKHIFLNLLKLQTIGNIK